MNTKDKMEQRLLEFIDEREREKREELSALLRDWHELMKANLSVDQVDLANDFVWDGFYPSYFRQPLKILFVGREALGLAGCDYLEVILKAYRQTKRIGNDKNPKHLNSAFYHSRMLRIAWGVLHGFADWSEIPCAADVGDTVATADGISFAMMNLSKLSNENEDSWAADWRKIGISVRHSGDFIRKQIDLLDPDVVISMNLGDYIGTFGNLESPRDEPHATRYLLRRGLRTSVVINTLHFSARRSQVTHYYNPICLGIANSIKEGWISDFRPRLLPTR